MAEIDLMSSLHRSTNRDYLARVNDPEYPKHVAAELAKGWGYDYWAGSGVGFFDILGGGEEERGGEGGRERRGGRLR